MSYEVVLCEPLKRAIKHFKKHYPHVAQDVINAAHELQESPQKGNVVPGGRGTRKLRVDNSDLNKGKSGSYRLLYYVVDQPSQTIFLIWLYAKGERENVSTREIIALLKASNLL